jgi:putative heme-binding domain-containing protein
LAGFLTSSEALSGDAVNGAKVFQKAQCAKCSQRFQRKEILESILFPSQVISDQYASKTVVTEDGKTYTGLVAPAGEEAVTILQSNGEKLTIANADISETAPSKVSAMPEGLLGALSLDEIADLFAYLNKPVQSSKVTVQPSKRVKR